MKLNFNYSASSFLPVKKKLLAQGKQTKVEVQKNDIVLQFEAKSIMVVQNNVLGDNSICSNP